MPEKEVPGDHSHQKGTHWMPTQSETPEAKRVRLKKPGEKAVGASN